MLIPVAVQYKAWVYGRSLAGTVGSNPARGMDVLSLASAVCVVRYRPLTHLGESYLHVSKRV